MRTLPGKALTKEGSIAYQKVIFATHFPVDNKHGWYFLKLYQHRSYVIALEQAAQLKGMYVDEAKKGMSFRFSEDIRICFWWAAAVTEPAKKEETGRN